MSDRPTSPFSLQTWEFKEEMELEKMPGSSPHTVAVQPGHAILVLQRALWSLFLHNCKFRALATAQLENVAIGTASPALPSVELTYLSLITICKN